ncbi:hypothetical protein Tco_0830387 [Tanacetum coccineum]
MTLCKLSDVDYRFQKIEDENVSLAFQVSFLVKEREHIKLEYKKLYDSIKQTRAQNKLSTNSLQQRLNDQISKNDKVRAQLQAKFSEPQLNRNGTSVNIKFSKPSTSGTKLYSVTPFPKPHVIPKDVEKNDLSKTVTSHLHTNKVIEKCTKFLTLGLLKIESEPINAYFKNNRVMHRDYLKVTKEHVETLQELLEQTRTLKPSNENLDYALPLVDRLQTIGVPAVAPNTETRMQFSIAKNSLMRAYNNCYVHPFINPSFAFARNYEFSGRSSWKFGFLGIVEIVLWYLDSGCSKHMTGQRDKFINFVSKFIGTVRFGNDHFAAIMGYGDLQLGNVLITRVYYVEGLGHNLFSVEQFCDLYLEVAFKKHTCFVRNLDDVDLHLGSRGSNL